MITFPFVKYSLARAWMLFAISLANPVSAQQSEDNLSSQVENLVQSLKQLSPTASREEFLGRPAMASLIAMGAKAYPTLKRLFLTEEEWAIKASLGYLVISMDNGSDDQTRVRITSLLKDDHPYVKTTAAILCATVPVRFANEEARRLLEAQGVDLKSVQVWRPSIEWLSDVHLSRVVESSMEVVDRGNPLLEPPQWSSFGGRMSDLEAHSVSASGLRLLTPTQCVAELDLRRVLLSERSHRAIEPVMRSLEQDDGVDQARLGRKLLLAEEALGHSGTCGGFDCRIRSQVADRLLVMCEKWVWVLNEPGALRAVVSALGDLAGRGFKRAQQILEELKDKHSNAEVQMLANLRLGEQASLRADAEAMRERKTVHEEQIKQRKAADRRTGIPEPRSNPPIQPKPPDNEPPQPSKRTRHWFIAGGLVLALLIASGVYFKIRARTTA